jgi:hypothetical protein
VVWCAGILRAPTPHAVWEMGRLVAGAP